MIPALPPRGAPPAGGRLTIRARLATTVVIGVLIVSGALGACTKDDGSSTSTTTAPAGPTASTTASTTSPATVPTDPARAAYVAQVNPICAERNDKIVSAALGATVPDTAAALAKRALFSVEASSQIRAIAPPPGDEDTIAAMLATLDQINQATADLSQAVLYADADAGRAAGKSLQDELPGLNEQFEAYGLSDCVLAAPTG